MVLRNSIEGRRMAAGVLCLFLILALLFSAAYAAAESGHECSGEKCAVCAVIRWCGKILKNGGITAAAVLTACVGMVSGSPAVFAVPAVHGTQGTPVGDRVRMNN